LSDDGINIEGLPYFVRNLSNTVRWLVVVRDAM